MIRPILIAFALWCFSFATISAVPLSTDKDLKFERFAANFLSMQKHTVSLTDEEISVKKVYQSADTTLNTILCWQDDNEGFVLLTEVLDNIVVLGYSPNSVFPEGEMPDALKSLIEFYETTPFEKADKETIKSRTVIVSPLLGDLKLNQFYHSEAGYCPTGCAATAMAQIMAFHKHPVSGVGENSYTHPLYGELSANFENTQYNWSELTDNDYKLISYHIAVAMSMNFCGDASGSIPSDSKYADVLQKHFKYHVHSGSRKSYYIVNEMDQGRPVYCEFPGNPAGHAVVIDGYDDEGFFHLNFGWGGLYNGFYAINNSSSFNAGSTFLGTNVSGIRYISPDPFITSEQDSLVMVEFYNNMGGVTHWDLKRPISNWGGVVVMNERVVEININFFYLTGDLPEDIGSLSDLRTIKMKGTITNPIPQSLYSLTNLRELSILGTNPSVKNSMPDEIGNFTELEILEMPNLFNGQLSGSIGNLTKLRILDLGSGGLTGEIPEQFYNLVNLEKLVLHNNNLSGNIDPKIGDLTKLKSLTLWRNNFSGHIPAEIGNLTNLDELIIAENMFSGQLPDEIENWTNIKVFNISDNQLEGKLPEGVTGFTNLTGLKLNNNHFTALPDNIGNMQNLQTLEAINNHLETLPASISQLTKLYRLYLTNNRITSLPDMGEMPALWDLSLTGNLLESLPESFGNLIRVSDLYLGNNLLTSLPASFENLTRLRNLALNGNKLTTVPVSFCFLSSLRQLSINGNQIDRPLPPLNHLGLTWVDIRNNRLVFSDIASSLLPDDVVSNDNYTFNYYHQDKVPVTDSIFNFPEETTVEIDIRKISRLSHPDNSYEWYHNGQFYSEGPVLVVEELSSESTGEYYCKVRNSKYRKVLVLETLPIKIGIEFFDPLAGATVLSSRDNITKEFSDNIVMLAPPEQYRGNLIWQASLDSTTWYSLNEDIENITLRRNILSNENNLILAEPVDNILFRYFLVEDDCDPVYSDTIRLISYGELLADSLINVKDTIFNIEIDSIDITVPSGFSSDDFRLTVKKLDNPPPPPEGIKMGSVYDVTVSTGTTFEVPLLIKLKNIDLNELSEFDIARIKPVYFDEQLKEWVVFEEGGVSVSDSAVHFYTNHLTKLSWFDLAHGSYTHIHTRDKVNIIYKWGVGGEDNFYTGYEYGLRSSPSESWHNSNTNPDNDGTPLMVQDAGEYMDQIIKKFDALGLSTPRLRFNVYIGVLGTGAAGQIGAAGYLAGRGYFYIDPTYNTDRDDLKRTLAHEYMHYTQDYYMTVLLNNYFWMEANAPLADRMVWPLETDLEISEPEIHLSEALVKTIENRTIFELWSKSWDADDKYPPVIQKFMVASAEANVSGTFLHYLRSYKSGERLKPEILLKNSPWLQSWKNYLDYHIQTYLNSNIGEQFGEYVKFLIEGSNERFTVLDKTEGADPLKYLKDAPSDFMTSKYYRFTKSGEPVTIKDSIQLAMPYLSAQMVQLYNLNIDNQKVFVRYKRKNEINNNSKLYLCRFDSETSLITFQDISANDSSTFIIDSPGGNNKKEQKHIAWLLFINQDKSQTVNIDYELEVIPIPEIKYFSSFGFTIGQSLSEAKIHVFTTDGTNEVTDQFWSMPAVFHLYADQYYSKVTYSSDISDESYYISARSNHLDMEVFYNFLTGEMTIYNKENWGGSSSNSTIDIREVKLILQNVWLEPITGTTQSRFRFRTANTEGTLGTIQSIEYTRKYSFWNNNTGEHNPMVTTTYLRTEYGEMEDVRFYLFFY